MKRRRSSSGGCKAKKAKTPNDSLLNIPAGPSTIQRASFLTVPLEIREQIYSLLYEEREYAIVLHHRRVKLQKQPKVPRNKSEKLGLANLPLSCRLFYNETISLLYTTGEFTFRYTRTLIEFERQVNPSARDMITYLDILEMPNIHIGMRGDENTWSELGTTIGSFRNLQNADLRIFADSFADRWFKEESTPLIPSMDIVHNSMVRKRVQLQAPLTCRLRVTIPPTYCFRQQRYLTAREHTWWTERIALLHNFELVFGTPAMFDRPNMHTPSMNIGGMRINRWGQEVLIRPFRKPVKKTKTTSSLPASTLDTPMGRGTVQTSKIFGIPPELRYQIWEHVYSKETITIVLYRNRPKQITEPTKRHLANMLLTCVLFSRETSSLFHHNITLSFRYSKTLRSFSLGISATLRQILTRLEVQEEWARIHPHPYPTERWATLGTVLGSFPNLERVVIDVFGEMDLDSIPNTIALMDNLDQTRGAMDAKRALEAQPVGSYYQHLVTPCSMVVITPRPWYYFRNAPVPQADRAAWHRIEDAKHDFTIIFGAHDKPVQAGKRRHSY